MKKEGWPGCEYQCSQCGHVKFVITNTFIPEIWEKCTDLCSWDSRGERGPKLRCKEGKDTGFHKRRFLKIDRIE